MGKWYRWYIYGGGRADRVLKEWFRINSLDFEAFERQVDTYETRLKYKRI